MRKKKKGGRGRPTHIHTRGRCVPYVEPKNRGLYMHMMQTELVESFYDSFSNDKRSAHRMLSDYAMSHCSICDLIQLEM